MGGEQEILKKEEWKTMGGRLQNREQDVRIFPLTVAPALHQPPYLATQNKRTRLL